MKLLNNKFQNEIKKLIPNDINLKYNGKVYPKHQLFLSHLIKPLFQMVMNLHLKQKALKL